MCLHASQDPYTHIDDHHNRTTTIYTHAQTSNVMCHAATPPSLQHFRDLVLEGSGPSLAGQLVAALVADQLDARGAGGAGGVAELAAALQAGAPAYFGDSDRAFFQATARLKAAEQAGSLAERDAAARDALSGLLRVPQCVDLAQLVGRLAHLRQYEVRVRGLRVFKFRVYG